MGLCNQHHGVSLNHVLNDLYVAPAVKWLIICNHTHFLYKSPYLKNSQVAIFEEAIGEFAGCKQYIPPLSATHGYCLHITVVMLWNDICCVCRWSGPAGAPRPDLRGRQRPVYPGHGGGVWRHRQVGNFSFVDLFVLGV